MSQELAKHGKTSCEVPPPTVYCSSSQLRVILLLGTSSNVWDTQLLQMGVGRCHWH